jgi:hypothetical protein
MDESRTADERGQLVGLLERQRGLYRRLRTLTQRQHSLILQEDPKPLLALLADRQRVVDGLLGVNQALAAYRRDWTNVYAGLDEATRRHVAEMLEEANASLGAILQSDSCDTAVLSARRQEVGERLTVVDNGSRATAAYATAGAEVRSGIADARA